MARKAKNNQVLDALNAFNATYKMTNQVAQDTAIANAAGATPETIETPTIKETTQGVDGMVKDSETGKALHADISHALSPEKAEQAKNDLNQIGTDLQTILRFLEEMSSEGAFNHHCSAIELVAMRAGTLTDRIIKNIGGVQVAGGFSDWFGLDDMSNERGAA